MDTISINEAIVAMLVGQDADPADAIMMLRKAQAVVMEYTGDVAEALYTQRDVEAVDDIIIMVTENGHRDIFA